MAIRRGFFGEATVCALRNGCKMGGLGGVAFIEVRRSRVAVLRALVSRDDVWTRTAPGAALLQRRTQAAQIYGAPWVNCAGRMLCDKVGVENCGF